MKVYSIGREAGCDILIHDATDVVSRRHAILNVTSSGKMTIVDQSHNGTYVNGIRISPNVPVPVTRKDNVSFAHVARLNWNMVPKTTTPMHYAMMSVAAIVVLAGAVFGYSAWSEGSQPKNAGTSASIVDSALLKKQVEDSLRRVDSLRIRKEDSLRNVIKKEEATKQKKTQTQQQQQQEARCATCKKVLSACDYHGKHPKLCGTCKKALSECEYHGKHPALCGTCKRPLGECEYHGKHPASGSTTSRGAR